MVFVKLTPTQRPITFGPPLGLQARVPEFGKLEKLGNIFIGHYVGPFILYVWDYYYLLLSPSLSDLSFEYLKKHKMLY